MKKCFGLFMAVLLIANCLGGTEVFAANNAYDAEQAQQLAGTVWYPEDTLEFEDCAVQVLYSYENPDGSEESYSALKASLETYGEEKEYNQFEFPNVTGATYDNVFAFMENPLDYNVCKVLFGGSDRTELSDTGRYFAHKTNVWMAQTGASAWQVNNVSVEGEDDYQNLCLYIEVVPYSEPEESTEAAETAAVAGCSHVIDHIITKEPTENEDGIISVKCTKCPHTIYSYKISGHGAFLKNSAKKIAEAKAGDTVIISTDRWVSFNKEVIEAIEKNPEVSVLVKYWYKGENRTLMIPAGTKLNNLLGEDGFCGFEYIAYQLALAATAE